MTFISIHSIIIYVIFFGACMRCTRLCFLKSGVADLKQKYWWYGLKKDVASHVALCNVCHRVKAKQQRPAGLLHPLKIPEWKWEEIDMDFIVGLPRTSARYDSIWVIVDGLTKVAHIIPVKTTYSGAKLAELYMAWIGCLHVVPKKIVSDRGS
jgi:hypothetical protein